ncbi:MAG: hypothetical protein WDM80_04655 [Limisphaerales bacterium]
MSTLINAKCTIAELKELRTLTGDENGSQRVAFTPMWTKTRAWAAGKAGRTARLKRTWTRREIFGPPCAANRKSVC